MITEADTVTLGGSMMRHGRLLDGGCWPPVMCARYAVFLVKSAFRFGGW